MLPVEGHPCIKISSIEFLSANARKGIFLHLMRNTGKWIALKLPKNPNEMNCVNLQKPCQTIE